MQLRGPGNEKLNQAQKRSLRNRISAFQARIKQKEEMTFLREEIETKDVKMERLVTVLRDFVNPEKIENLVKKLSWGEKAIVSMNLCKVTFTPKKVCLMNFDETTTK